MVGKLFTVEDVVIGGLFVISLLLESMQDKDLLWGLEAKDNILGRQFGFGAIVRSDRVSQQWTCDKSSPIVKEFVSVDVELGGKKRYLTEPAVAVILELVRKICAGMMLSYQKNFCSTFGEHWKRIEW
uniref:Uncharacterized protein n=1 Tax=Zea mays TaxID=4577 RepID=A0A804NF63_MAIZE